MQSFYSAIEKEEIHKVNKFTHLPETRQSVGDMQISLVVPIKNESESLETLINSVKLQTFQPTEIIFVDGGSTDNTREIAEKLFADDTRFRLIAVPEATPGKGRNIGVENARCEWIAFTDAGIRLDQNWLANLVAKVEENPTVDVVYGNFKPCVDNFFVKCAIISYVPAQQKTGIRRRFIASSLLRKAVWEKVGGVPDLRAAEDLYFMEAIDEYDHKIEYAPEAMVYWNVNPTIIGTFKRFVLYSTHNVYAGRQWDWHNGVARQYLFVSVCLILSFLFSWWFLIGAAFFMSRRAFQRLSSFRHEFGMTTILNPFVVIGTLLTGWLIDLATFIGWLIAMNNPSKHRPVKISRKS